MSTKKPTTLEREFDFALIVGGVPELTQAVTDALFEAGCDDATLSIQYGLLYVEFSRAAASLEEAIVSAIQNVQKSGIGGQVLQVDECNFVTASEIARRIERSRQLVHQYITGQRGPGGFPPPACHLDDERAPLWQWCAVSFWLVQNGLLRKEEARNAEVVYAINCILDKTRQPAEVRRLVSELAPRLSA